MPSQSLDKFASAVFADTGEPDLITETGSAGYGLGGRVPDLVAQPKTHEAVARVLARAGEAGLAVVPWGGGTSRRGGYPPARYDVALATGRLSGVVDLLREDLTVVVGAGMTVSSLNSLTVPEGQTAGLDPPHPDRATVGGTIIADRSGPMRVRFGRARDRVMRMRVALADGSTQTYGALVVKNVTGYDMNRLLAGSWGTLAVVTELAIRLYKNPERVEARAAGFPSAAAAFGAARKLTRMALSPMWIEVVDAGRITALRGGSVGIALPGPWCLAAAYGDFREGLMEQLGRAEDLFEKEGGAELHRFHPEEAARLSRALADSPGGEFNDSGALEFRASGRLDQLPRFAAAAVSAARAGGGYRLASAAHAASGVFRCWLSPGSENVSPLAAWEAFREGARAGADREKGRAVHVTISAAPASLRDETDVFGEDALDSPAIELMRRLKAEYDPQGTLSPGRFVARI